MLAQSATLHCSNPAGRHLELLSDLLDAFHRLQRKRGHCHDRSHRLAVQLLTERTSLLDVLRGGGQERSKQLHVLSHRPSHTHLPPTRPPTRITLPPGCLLLVGAQSGENSTFNADTRNNSLALRIQDLPVDPANGNELADPFPSPPLSPAPPLSPLSPPLSVSPRPPPAFYFRRFDALKKPRRRYSESALLQAHKRTRCGCDEELVVC